MKVYDASGIRNIAVVGHGGAGKTSLTSALLFTSGAVNRLGKVDEGNTITDYDEEAIERKKSITASLCHLVWNKTKVNVIDTPGFSAFLHETRAAMRVVEGAVIVVEATSGVEVNTEKAWNFADEFNAARIFVINRLDKERASFTRTMESIQSILSRAAVPLQIPLGEEKEFKGFIDLLKMKAFVFETDESGKFTEGEIPETHKDATNTAREKLIEAVAEVDDKLMEGYFESGTLSDEDLARGLKQGVAERKLFPVLLTNATLSIGSAQVLDAIVDLIPSPAAVGEFKGTNPDAKDGENEITRKGEADEPASAFVFKTLIDPFAGQISFFRVYSGTIKSDSALMNTGRNESERFGAVNVAEGKSLTAVREARAGDIAAVTKLKVTETGDTLAEKSDPIIYAPVEFPDPAISWAIEPKSRADEEKISAALHKLLGADPMLRLSRDPQTHEMLVSCAGQEHVEVMLSKLKRQGVEATLKLPKIPYRETITRAAKYVEYTHKKQSGGAGQYAKVVIDLEPLPRDEGYKFEDKIVGGVIDQQYRPSVDKGVQQKKAEGVIAGFPVVDIKVSLVDGKTHPVDSKDIAFQIAGRHAFKKAVADCKPVLLEPIMAVEIVAPEEAMGDIVGDLNSRRGRVLGMEAKGHNQVINATVPLAEMLNYSATLNSITSGRGAFHMESSAYDQVPGNLQEKIVEEAKAAAGEKAEAD
jgi:elongation factor G